MADDRNLTTLIEQAAEFSGRGADSADACGSAEQWIRAADALARDRIKDALRGELNTIADKLEMGVALTTAEERSVEIAVIGPALAYIGIENNVADWKSELQRLFDELRLASSKNDVAGLIYVRALCRDALSVISDLLIYLREQERIQRFREGASSGDPERGRIIARFIRESLVSDSH